jgi:hypothetical protein
MLVAYATPLLIWFYVRVMLMVGAMAREFWREFWREVR